MPRDPYADRHLDGRLAALTTIVLTVAVVGGIALAWQRFEADVNTTYVSGSPSTPSPTSAEAPSDDPSDDTEPTESPASTEDAAEAPSAPQPTFEPLTAGDGQEDPVVLLVADGYGAGAGASSVGTAYPSLLARDLGWDLRLATARGAGYTVPGAGGRTLASLLQQTPADLDPGLIIVQGGYGGDVENPVVKEAIAEMASTIESRYPDAAVVAVTPFWPSGEPTKTAQTRESVIARAWRAAGAFLVRPQVEDWSEVTYVGNLPDDPGHQAIAARLQTAFATAGLTSK